jgi:hypothetical protein
MEPEATAEVSKTRQRNAPGGPPGKAKALKHGLAMEGPSTETGPFMMFRPGFCVHPLVCHALLRGVALPYAPCALSIQLLSEPT